MNKQTTCLRQLKYKLTSNIPAEWDRSQQHLWKRTHRSLVIYNELILYWLLRDTIPFHSRRIFSL